jgi:photosystem II stability/assembly factor-like uncharacterized protein
VTVRIRVRLAYDLVIRGPGAAVRGFILKPGETTMRRILAATSCALLIAVAPLAAAKPKADAKEPEKKGLSADTFAGLELRALGPALTSGRIVDIAVDPSDSTVWYVAVASGGVWKTTNSGTSWTPVFDGEASFSIGCLAIDPGNPAVVWVGTGENNSQRSVAYGDGVYKSEDAGKSWKRMGLEKSEHIGKILVDPRDSQVVWVAAQGPLWAPGGDRGLYVTRDGGKSWTASLSISEHTGVSDVAFDPRDPDTLYAAAYQRRRHVWTLIDGGPESALHKSTDGGKSWKKLESGLPKEEMGRIGIAVSPVDPDVVYALIESTEKAGGTFRSSDRGATWEKRGDYVPGGPQYYQEIFTDPKLVDRVYSMDVFLQVSDDGGKTWRNLGESSKHVDNHALWIDPQDTDHYLVGCDGGLYESFDRGASWKFFGNLPVTQFYKIEADNAAPIYNVYGGTQDNFSLAGPSRTRNVNGIANSDWFVTWGGDGFQTRVDPEDPSIVYAQSQYGVLTRFDRRTGEATYIQPQEGKGEEALRWNWDSPLAISPHSRTRLYFAANRLFRSDDRGDTWRAVSPDLTRRIDRNRLPVMGKVWSIDSVAKNSSTSLYGNIVALSESPRVEGLLYVGTDDGLVQVSEDGGQSWRKVESFPGVPDRAYVRRLEASRHDDRTVYAAFDNHKMGDFKPYVLKSADRGRTWTAIAGDLPERGTVYALAEDHEQPRLLFAGTEFGLFFTLDGGQRWIRLKGGLPTIQVRDLAIQRRENDLVVGTFGRGIYVLDDYSPLRQASEKLLETEAEIYPVKDASMFMPATPLGLRDKSFQGDDYYLAPNPPAGAVLTYYLKDEIKTRKKERRAREKEVAKEGGTIAYPSWDELRAEAHEEEPTILISIADAEGHVVRRLTGPVSAGFHRVAWDLRYPHSEPTELKPRATDNPFVDPPLGPMVVPGTYTVTLAKRVDGKTTPLASAQSFAAAPLGSGSLGPVDRAALLAFQEKTARLQRAALGAAAALDEAQGRLDHVKRALLDTPAADPAWGDEARALEARLREVRVLLRGDRVLRQRSEPDPPAILDRVGAIVASHWTTVSAPTRTNLDAYQVAGEALEGALAKLRAIIDQDLAALEERLEAAGGPWTPGRGVPRFERE